MMSFLFVLLFCPFLGHATLIFGGEVVPVDDYRQYKLQIIFAFECINAERQDRYVPTPDCIEVIELKRRIVSDPLYEVTLRLVPKACYQEDPSGNCEPIGTCKKHVCTAKVWEKFTWETLDISCEEE